MPFQRPDGIKVGEKRTKVKSVGCERTAEISTVCCTAMICSQHTDLWNSLPKHLLLRLARRSHLAFASIVTDPLSRSQIRNVVDPSLSSTDSYSNGPTAFKTESLAGSFVLAHRIPPNIELSLAASWSYARSPYSGSTTGSAFHNSGGVNPTLTSTFSSSDLLVSNNSHSFDVSASLVILGY